MRGVDLLGVSDDEGGQDRVRASEGGSQRPSLIADLDLFSPRVSASRDSFHDSAPTADLAALLSSSPPPAPSTAAPVVDFGDHLLVPAILQPSPAQQTQYGQFDASSPTQLSNQSGRPQSFSKKDPVSVLSLFDQPKPEKPPKPVMLNGGGVLHGGMQPLQAMRGGPPPLPSMPAPGGRPIMQQQQQPMYPAHPQMPFSPSGHHGGFMSPSGQSGQQSGPNSFSSSGGSSGRYPMQPTAMMTMSPGGSGTFSAGNSVKMQAPVPPPKPQRPMQSNPSIIHTHKAVDPFDSINQHMSGAGGRGGTR